MGNKDHDEELARAFERMFHNYSQKEEKTNPMVEVVRPISQFFVECLQQGFSKSQALELTKTFLSTIVTASISSKKN